MFELIVRQPVDAEVVVLGAGPAGAAAAIHLARAGVDVLLVDRRSFPRDKICGDFVSHTALLELADLGLAETNDIARAVAISSAAVHLDGEPLIARGLPVGPDVPHLGRVIPRMQLDVCLVEAAARAGARIIEGANVKSVEHRGSHLELEVAGRARRTLKTRLVVGADGSNSLAARFVRGGQPSRRDRIIAVRAYYDNVGDRPNEVDLFFTRETFPGYTWVFPLGGGLANVGVGMVQVTVPPQDEHLRHMLARIIERDPAVRSRLSGASPASKVVGWPLSTYNPRAPVLADGLLLVGDAAGLINPLNGEGIQYALASGRWAAETVVSSGGDYSSERLAPYAARLDRELRLDMTLARMIVQGISNRSLNALWLQILRAITLRASTDADYAATAGGILAGLVPASEASSRRFLNATVAEARGLTTNVSGRQMSAGAARTALAWTGALARHPIGTTAWSFEASRAVADFVREATRAESALRKAGAMSA